MVQLIGGINRHTQKYGCYCACHALVVDRIMAGRKKRSSGNTARYFSQSSGQYNGHDGKRTTNGYCSDKRLLPRIKQVGKFSVTIFYVTLQAG